MNTKTIAGAILLTALCALGGCSTHTLVTMQDGSQYLTKHKPDTKTADGFYEFTDLTGKTIRVRADDVATIKEED